MKYNQVYFETIFESPKITLIAKLWQICIIYYFYIDFFVNFNLAIVFIVSLLVLSPLQSFMHWIFFAIYNAYFFDFIFYSKNYIKHFTFLETFSWITLFYF
jgi:hypothetical protein